MLHFAIICIVCAASAPSEGITFNKQKYNESNTFCNFEGGEQNVAKVSFPSVYNVAVQNSSDCAKPRNTFFYDNNIKQYQNSKNNSCSIMERVPLGEDKHIDFVYRKRNLLWNVDEKKFKPKTLRPPVGSDGRSCTSVGGSTKRPMKKVKSLTLKLQVLWKKIKPPIKFLKLKKKFKSITPKRKPSKKKKFDRDPENCRLTSKEKKVLLCLKKLNCRGKKPKGCQSDLERLTVDDDLDLNKRIEKMVEKLAEDKHNKVEGLEEGLMGEGKNNQKIYFKNENELLPVFSNIKKLFGFNKNYFGNRMAVVSSRVPLSYLQDVFSDRPENVISTNDFQQAAGKITRLRRNPHKSHKYNRNKEPGNEDKLIGRLNADFKARFAHPRASRKFLPGRTKRRRCMLKRMRRNKLEKGLRPLLKNAFHKLCIFEGKHNCQEKSTVASITAAATATTTTETPEGIHSGVTTTRTLRLSMRDETAEFIPGGWNFVGDYFPTTTSQPITTQTEGKLESTTGKEEESIITRAILIPGFAIEKPPLSNEPKQEKDCGCEKFAIPFENTTAVSCSTQDIENQTINPYTYLKIRHILRDYIIHKKVDNPKKTKVLCKRKKRYGSKHSASNCHKNWRSAPLLCIPYIRKGQEDQLKYLIKVIQNMMGKPIPPKSDIFEKTKFKPSFGRKRYSPRDFSNDESEAYNFMSPYQCNFPLPSSKMYQQFSSKHCLVNSNPPYDLVNQGRFYDPYSALLAVPTTPNFPLSSSVEPCLSQNANLKSPILPISFPFMETKKPAISPPSPNVLLAPSTTPGAIYPSSEKAPVFLVNKASPNTPPSNSNTTSTTTTTTTTTPASSDCPCDSVSSSSSEPTASASGQRIQPSTVNSVLQESETQSEKESTTASASGKGEESTTVNSHFSGASSEESSTQQHRKLEVSGDQEPISKEIYNAYRANYKQQNSLHRSPETLARYKDPEAYNSEYLSRLSRSKNDQNIWKFELNQKLFDDNQLEAPYGQHRHRFKKRNSRLHSQSGLRGSFWSKYFKGNYHPPEKSAGEASTVKSLVFEEETPATTTEQQYYLMESTPQNHKVKEKVTVSTPSTPLYQTKHYMPLYDEVTTVSNQQQQQQQQQTQKIEQHSTHHWLKLGSLLPFFHATHKEKNSLAEKHIGNQLNPLAKQIGNSKTESYATATPSPIHYDMTLENNEERTFQKRQKRGDDYYFWPDNDYSDYFYDPNYPDENMRTQLSLSHNPSDPGWTPPSYDMFSELAKAVTQPDELESSRSSDIPRPLNFSAETTTVTITTSTENTTKTTVTTEGSTVDPCPSSGKLKNRIKDSKKSIERISKHYTGVTKNSVESREDKGLQGETEMIAAEDGHGPTTLKSALIVRGQKKVMTKPSPKVYTKVFPDFYEGEGENCATTSATTKATEAANVAKPTEQMPLPIKPDLRLQILAVCEGYLEVVKLIKAQNQTLGGDLDENLARYCENIISQNFNFQSEKPKKLELIESFTATTTKKDSEKGSDTSGSPEVNDDFVSQFSGRKLRRMTRFDKHSSPIFKRELHHKNKNFRLRGKLRRLKKKRRKARLSHRHRPKLRKRIRRKEETEDEVSKKGVSKEQMQLIRLLRKRKKALLSWLLNSKDGIKPDELQETEYFDEEDLMEPESELTQSSGTIKPRRDETTSRTTKKNKSFSNSTIFPVYAKEYGYDSGGELIEVEVLWRQVNEKTHENKIFKNLSVLALLLTSTSSPKIKHEETKLVGDDSEEIIDTNTKWKNKNKMAFDAARVEAECDNITTTACVAEVTEVRTTTSDSVVKKMARGSGKTNRKNNTHTFISKPDPKSIVGAPTNANKTHRKISHKYGVAKDIFQEYSIEFLNYAVYILPMMFTILFLLCCWCCALHILKTQKSHKRRKKKKKKAVSSEETTDSATSETESKKRKREAKRKRLNSSKENYDNTHKKKSKTFWNYLKVYNRPSRDMNEENEPTDKKRSILGFLKGKRDDGKPGYSSAPTRETDEDPQTYPDSGERKHYSDHFLTSRLRKREEDKRKSSGQSEAAERRELIALLEELKKIETEHIGAKKEVKSVHVQYVTPECENSVIEPKSQIPDFSYPYEKNIFGMPKGVCPFYSKKFHFNPTLPPAAGNLYDDMNELAGLLPWDYYSQRNDLLKHCDIKINQTGRCDGFLKIFRDSGTNKPVVEKNFRTNESENRSFIFNKYRSISTDRSEEFMGVPPKKVGTDVKVSESGSPYKLSSKKDADLVEDAENLKSHPNKKKFVRLKDKGVLCRF